MRHITLDFEATDYVAAAARPFELAVVEFDPETGRSIAEKCWKMNPGVRISDEVFRITGMSNQTARRLPQPTAHIYREALRFVAGARVYIHRRAFDEPLFDKVAAEFGLGRLGASASEVVCTVAPVRRLGCEPATLDGACDRLGIDRSQRRIHSALVDCRLLARVVSTLFSPERAGLDQMALILDHAPDDETPAEQPVRPIPIEVALPTTPPRPSQAPPQPPSPPSPRVPTAPSMATTRPAASSPVDPPAPVAVAVAPAPTPVLPRSLTRSTTSWASRLSSFRTPAVAATVERLARRTPATDEEEQEMLQHRVDVGTTSTYTALQEFVALRGWRIVHDGRHYISIEIRDGAMFDVMFEFENTRLADRKTQAL